MQKGSQTLCLCWNRADLAGPFRYGDGLELCGIVYFQAFLRPNRPPAPSARQRRYFYV